jgi:DNA-binding NarL/FixJ family response regulator
VLHRARIANPIVSFGLAADASAFLAARSLGDRGAAEPLPVPVLEPSPVLEPLPVLMLLDLGLPDGSGLALLTDLRRRYDRTQLPVVILSGSAQSADIDRAFEIGANAYLVKPVAFDALIDTLENLGLTRAFLPASSLGK